VLLAYNVLLLLLLLPALPFALAWLAASRRARAGLAERLTPPRRSPEPVVWVHAASLGEAEAAAPLVAALLERGIPARVTALTVTGRDRVRARFRGLSVRLAPLDLPGLVHASVARMRARVLVLVETELWPNLLAATRAAGGRIVLVSARVSDRSFPRYRALGRFFAPALEAMHAIGARSDEDRRRLLALGAPPERTSVVGDLKLDRPPAGPPGPELRAALGPGPLLVGGSTHAGEEEALVESWRALRAGPAPGLRLVLVPRHPERAAQVLAAARRLGADAGMRSADPAGRDVVVVDTVGELGAIYHLADLVFCGGTLAPIGGHNLFEPVIAGKVVVHGAHLENQRSQQALLAPLGVLHAADDARALTGVFSRLWSDPRRHAPAERAGPLLEAHRGAVERALRLVMEAWGAPA
jgi:3-deoxy-D-manno-octulosonic-acid transferase